MARIIEGVAMIAGAVILSVVTAGLAAPIAALFLLADGIGIAGIGLTISGVVQALTAGPSIPFSVRQPAAPRQIVYGESRIAGTIVYEGTSGNSKELNTVVAWAGHQVQSIDTIYLDARAVILSGDRDDGNNHLDDANNQYNFHNEVIVNHSLGTVPGTYFSTLGAADSKWDSTCTLDGIAASCIEISYDTNNFPSGPPGIKANIHGKCDIYDPRDGTHKYTNNWALVIADVLCNTEFGLGCVYATEIDEDQLIAAANLCDESVTLASGLTEPRYTLNGFFDTNSSPGDIIDAMLASAEGRISYQGGKFKIFPGAWYGSGLVFYDSDIVGPVKWSPKRKYRDLINAVRATFTCPKFPYASIGYSQDVKQVDEHDNGIFSGQWQPTDIPEYAQDTLHGYSSDVNLAADGNVKLYATRSYRFTTSVATAQRLAKIYLLRNRQQGTGTLKLDLAAYQAAAQDVIQVNFAGLSWTNKYLEITNMKFVAGSDSSGGNSQGDQQNAPTLQVEMQVCETDPSIYEWSTAEEMGIENSVSPSIDNAWSVNPPSSLILESGIDSAVVGVDGVTIPRIHVNWVEPDDPFTIAGGYVELQWQKIGDSTWKSVGALGPTVTDYFVTGVVCAQQYNVQLRAVRSNGATSGWVQAGPHTVSTTLSSFSYETVTGLGTLATLNNVDFSSGEVTNKDAAYVTYSNTLSVEALRPAEASADATFGKSIDILVDGTYARIKGSELINGISQGKSFGSNMLGNPGFELNSVGTALGAYLAINQPLTDEWYVGVDSGQFLVVAENDGSQHSGACNLLLRANSNTSMPGAGTTATRVISTHHYPVIGGSGLYFGGWITGASNVLMPAGFTITQRVGIMVYQSDGTYIGEYYWDTDTVGTGANQVSYGWTQVSGTITLPLNAAYCVFQCSAFNTGSTETTPNGLMADLRFDDLFLMQQYGTSSVLNPQGSIQPNQPITITYTTTNSSITFSWTAQSMLRSDGSTMVIQNGTITYSGLAPSTTYYIYFYANVATGFLGLTNGSFPPTSPSSLMAAQTGLDGRIPVAAITPTTLASGNGGQGGGTGGGGSTCPESAELVDILGKGQIAAGTVKQGDLIKGKSFKSGTDVYRKVLQVNSVSGAAWRMIDGHRVSPCESVYSSGSWMPAYRVTGATLDTMVGTKVLISVEADEYGEHNYYLVSGTSLLIHNLEIYPC